MRNRRFRTILVDDDVFELLKSRAVPFKDQPNDVLRRLLGMAPAKGLATETHLSRRTYLGELILQELEREGGSSSPSHVLAVIEEILDPTDRDMERVRPGIERWKKDSHFARLALVRQGLIRGDAPRGTWELTEAGRKRARQMLRQLDDAANA